METGTEHTAEDRQQKTDVRTRVESVDQRIEVKRMLRFRLFLLVKAVGEVPGVASGRSRVAHRIEQKNGVRMAVSSVRNGDLLLVEVRFLRCARWMGRGPHAKPRRRSLILAGLQRKHRGRRERETHARPWGEGHVLLGGTGMSVAEDGGGRDGDGDGVEVEDGAESRDGVEVEMEHPTSSYNLPLYIQNSPSVFASSSLLPPLALSASPLRCSSRIYDNYPWHIPDAAGTDYLLIRPDQPGQPLNGTKPFLRLLKSSNPWLLHSHPSRPIASHFASGGLQSSNGETQPSREPRTRDIHIHTRYPASLEDEAQDTLAVRHPPALVSYPSLVVSASRPRPVCVFTPGYDHHNHGPNNRNLTCLYSKRLLSHCRLPTLDAIFSSCVGSWLDPSSSEETRLRGANCYGKINDTMGCMNSKDVSPEMKEQGKQSAAIDKAIRADKKKYDRTVKILLLGAGESGKSTIIKQMRIIHSGGFPIDERRQTRAPLAHFVQNSEADVECDEAFTDIKVREAVKTMWEDAGVQKAVARGHEFALHDNLHYYFHSLDRIFTPGWLPNNQDMLHSRLRTTGITETLFELGQINFRMMDVGGQRSERKKWIHCFEGVQCLLFMVALSGYDQCLVEDQTANQMHEAMMLFESLVNGEWFKRKPVILFLNKIDLFKEKLAISPVSRHFPDYSGRDGDFDASAKYFGDRFRGITRVPEREIYTHYTNATDTTLLKATMDSVQDMIIQKNLNNLIL
ncbi:small G-protein GPA2 [Arthroderma uncinatum]|uniref:small G-protein GPA2 n=1 Tax=Arthroderma uncinatum TaxID=74035 RepID=UPI00144A56AB|nr:small G-protein GPA2 [Arthroderma uncinatum]KAF3490757.1 small G-protein GPA2 [Arthroderma uncinatum]